MNEEKYIMQYEIFGDNLPAITINLEAGESIYTQSGGLSWMSSDIQMDTNMSGGLAKGIGRMLTGQSLFMVTFTARSAGQSVTIASNFPGYIIPLDVSRSSYVCQKSAFLCAEQTVQLNATVTKKLGAGLFGGEGFIMQEVSGSGLVFLEIDGSVKEMNLARGEKIIVQTGNVAAFESNVKYSVETVKGFKNVLFGGEGLFLTTLEGPGKVYLQTMTAAALAGRISPFISSIKS
jgi:uncharacterized protein (TIGR00266 family)